MLFIKILVVFTLVYIPPHSSSAKEIHVSTEGQDTKECGDKRTPCLSINHAVNISHTDDMILMISHENETFDVKTLNIEHSLTLKSSDDKQVNVECEEDSYIMTQSDTNYIALETLSFHNCVFQSKASRNHMRYCVFESSNVSIEIGAINAEIKLKGCIFNNSRMAIDALHQNFKYEGSIETNLTIQDSLFNGKQTIFTYNNEIYTNMTLNTLIRNVIFTHLEYPVNIITVGTLKIIFAISEMTHCFSKDDCLVIGANELTANFNNNVIQSNFCKKSGLTIYNRGNKNSMKVNINECLFRNNTSLDAGSALHITSMSDSRNFYINNGIIDTDIFITNTTFSNNLNHEAGAAIFIKKNVMKIKGCKFYNNFVVQSTSENQFSYNRKGTGGALYIEQTAFVYISDSVFRNNYAIMGGGCISALGNVSIENTYFQNKVSNVISTYHKIHDVTTGDILYMTGQVWINNITLDVQATLTQIPVLWFTSDYKFLVPIDRGYVEIICPIGSHIVKELITTNYRNTMAYKDLIIFCKPCSGKTYTMQREYLKGNLSENLFEISGCTDCLKCSYGGACANGKIVSKINFWGYNKNNTAKFLPCPERYCCNSQTCSTYDECAFGRTGTLCGQCDNGKSELLHSPECKDNQQCSYNGWHIISYILAVIMYVVVFMYQFEICHFVSTTLLGFSDDSNNRKSYMAIEKTVFYFYQTVYLLNVTNKNKTEKTGVIFTNFFCLQPILAFFRQCFFQDMGPVKKILLSCINGFSIFIILLLIYFIIYLHELKKRKDSIHHHHIYGPSLNDDDNSTNLKARVISAFIYVALYNYVNIVKTSFELINCVNVDGTNVLLINGNIICYEPWQIFFILMTICHVIPFFIVVYSSRSLLDKRKITCIAFLASYFFPLPFLLYWNIKWFWFKWKGRHALREEELTYIMSKEFSKEFERMRVEILSIIEEPYVKDSNSEVSILYWESILIFRRLIIAVFATFILDKLLSVTLRTAACIIFLAWHIHIKPYSSAAANNFETISLLVLALMSTCHIIQATFYTVGDIPEGPSALQMQCTDWMEWILVNILPFTMILIIIVSSLIRLSKLMYHKLESISLYVRTHAHNSNLI